MAGLYVILFSIIECSSTFQSVIVALNHGERVALACENELTCGQLSVARGKHDSRVR